MRALVAVVLWSTVAASACQPDATAEPARAPAPVAVDPVSRASAKRFERDMLLRFHMQASFDAARSAERLFVGGKLEDGRRFARDIAVAPEVSGMQPWAVQLETVRARAAAVATSPSIPEGLRRVARLAEACARCHVDTEARAELAPRPAMPVDRDTIEARMARHRWAIDRIWEGMIVDSDDAWQAGLGVLAARPLDARLFGDARARVELARELQRRAAAAEHIPEGDIGARAAAYGELLVTCAGCHATTARRD